MHLHADGHPFPVGVERGRELDAQDRFFAFDDFRAARFVRLKRRAGWELELEALGSRCVSAADRGQRLDARWRWCNREVGVLRHVGVKGDAVFDGGGSAFLRCAFKFDLHVGFRELDPFSKFDGDADFNEWVGWMDAIFARFEAEIDRFLFTARAFCAEGNRGLKKRRGFDRFLSGAIRFRRAFTGVARFFGSWGTFAPLVGFFYRFAFGTFGFRAFFVGRTVRPLGSSASPPMTTPESSA